MTMPMDEPVILAETAPEKKRWSRPELIDISSDLDDIETKFGAAPDGPTLNTVS